jgi:alkylresorcinol/alkylpyrone synthase
MFLRSIHGAVPSSWLKQEDCLDLFLKSGTGRTLEGRSKNLLEKVLRGNSGIEKRHFAHEDLERLFGLDAGELNLAFEDLAPGLAGNALAGALERAGLGAGEVAALLVCSCTGYLCPGLSSHIAERLGLREDAYLLDVVGLGCGAAIPLLRSAAGFLALHPGAKVACVAVEVCSAAFYLDDDPGVLISACLFGDGACATVWSDEASGALGRCGGFDTLHWPQHREKVRFVNAGGKLKNKLCRTVPEVCGEAVGVLQGRSGNGHRPTVLVHPGGKLVLDAIAGGCPQGGDLAQSRSVLRDYGNMSSPSVLFALERWLRDGRESHAWLSSFGAGFSCHACGFERL